MPYTHILAATDFSPVANHALRYAFEEATVHHARLTVVHVLHHHPASETYYIKGDPEIRSGLRDALVGFDPAFEPDFGTRMPTLPSVVPETIRRDYTAEAQTQLHGLVFGSFTGTWEAEVATGDPAEAILRIAQERDAALIVVGTHGRTGLQHVLLGSVAEKVVRHARCPVLVTRV